VKWDSLQNTTCPHPGLSDEKSSLSGDSLEFSLSYLCDGKSVCSSLSQLVKNWQSDKRFRDRFSPATQRRVKEILTIVSRGPGALLYRKYNPDLSENCSAFSFLPLTCSSQKLILTDEKQPVPHCEYVVASLLGNLLGITPDYKRYKKSGSCIPNLQVIEMVQKNCQSMNLEVLRLVYFDVWNELITEQFDQIDLADPFLKWLGNEDLYRLRMKQKRDLRNLSQEEICRTFTFFFQTLPEYQRTGKEEKSSSSWAQFALKKLNYLGANYISPDFIETLLINLFPSLTDKVNREMIYILAIALNLSFFVLSFFVSWKVFLLLYPEGRSYLIRMFNDPLLATSFVVSLALAGISPDVIVSFIQQLSQFLGVSIPQTTALQTIGQISKELFLSQVQKISLDQLPAVYRDKIRANLDFPRPLRDALQKVDEKLRVLQQQKSSS
jgi:hypothetical protein